MPRLSAHLRKDRKLLHTLRGLKSDVSDVIDRKSYSAAYLVRICSIRAIRPFSRLRWLRGLATSVICQFSQVGSLEPPGMNCGSGHRALVRAAFDRPLTALAALALLPYARHRGSGTSMIRITTPAQQSIKLR